MAHTEAASVSETHSAWVVFLGDRAYKLKKPVKLEFLDFSTREARRRVAHREVELNRRLAPDVYLGVADVTGTDGKLCDHIVVMRRMPADRRLSALVDAGVALDDEIRAIARTIAAFHGVAATSPEISAAGSPEAIRGKIERDLSELRPFTGAVIDASELDEVSILVHRYLAGRTRLLEARVDGGYIRDGHGDLLADDVFCMPDGPRILDCIEFDDQLRFGDVLADVAFLAMDLERLGAPHLGDQFLSWYSKFTNERHPESLVHYYIACRALVRSKVACVRAGQGEPAVGAPARELMSLARRHLRRGRVRLALVGGAPGTGKSTLAAGLAARLGWPVLRSDEVRKDVAGLGHGVPSRAPLNEGMYDAASTRATYDALLDRARHALQLGESVILDASWSHRDLRAAAGRLAGDTASDLIALRCDVAAETAAERIVQRRARKTDISDADVEVGAAMRAHFHAWPSARVISTAASPERAVEDAIAVLEPDR